MSERKAARGRAPGNHSGVSDHEQSSDRRVVHRVLAGRLTIAVVLIASAIAALAYLLERSALERRFIDRAVLGAEQFMSDAGALFGADGAQDRAAVQERFDAFARVPRAPLPEGRTIAVVVYDAAGPVARFASPDYRLGAEASAALAALPPPAGAITAVTGQAISIANLEHVLVRMPLRAADGRQVGQAASVFAISPQFLAQERRLLWIAATAAAAIVLITGAVLYPIIARLLRRVESAAVDLLDANLDMLKVIGSAIAKRDSDTDLHNYRVTLYAVRLAEALDLDVKAMQGLMKGSFLHDVGKIGVPDRILLKPGRLTDEEFDEMRRHVAYGCEIVSHSVWLADAVGVVRGHHEKFDGSGYDGGLRGEAIPLAARIFAIADVYDALTSRRPYKEPLTHDAAMAILEQGRDQHFDGRLLDAFARIARPLFDEFANRDDAHPRQALAETVRRYFRRDLAAFLN